MEENDLIEAIPLETPRLWEFLLSEHDHGSICISSSYRNGAAFQLDPRDWLDRGYEGIRIIGTGANPTHILPTAWDGNTTFMSRHPGVMRWENVALHAGTNTAAYFGEQNFSRVVVPKFRYELVGSTVQVDPPRPGASRTKWPLFGYQVDGILQDVQIWGGEAREHDLYVHNYARWGWLIERVTVHSAGAEVFKFRGDALETAWAGPRCRIVIRDCSLTDWYQVWSDRGGAGIVLQGAAADLWVTDCLFWGGAARGDLPAHLRSRAIMVSSENVSYDRRTGQVGGDGPGNGHVWIQRCGIVGGPGAQDWSSSELIRVGRNSGTQKAAQSVRIEDCGIYGLREHVAVKDIGGNFVLQRCNTPEIRERASAIGMQTEHEASWLGGGSIQPISEGVGTPRADPAG